MIKRLLVGFNVLILLTFASTGSSTTLDIDFRITDWSSQYTVGDRSVTVGGVEVVPNHHSGDLSYDNVDGFGIYDINSNTNPFIGNGDNLIVLFNPTQTITGFLLSDFDLNEQARVAILSSNGSSELLDWTFTGGNDADGEVYVDLGQAYTGVNVYFYGFTGDGYKVIGFNETPVPEPATMLLFGLGLLGLAGVNRRKQ